MRPVTRVILGVGIEMGACRRSERETGRQDTFRVSSEVVGDEVDTLWGDEGSAPSRVNVGEEGDDEESLFGRVEEMSEEVAVDVPVAKVVWMNVLCGRFELGCAEIEDEAVTPSRTCVIDTLFASEKVLHG